MPQQIIPTAGFVWQVLVGAKALMVAELGAEPAVRSAIRELFFTQATLSTGEAPVCAAPSLRRHGSCWSWQMQRASVQEAAVQHIDSCIVRQLQGSSEARLQQHEPLTCFACRSHSGWRDHPGRISCAGQRQAPARVASATDHRDRRLSARAAGSPGRLGDLPH